METSESQVRLSGSAVALQRQLFPFESLSIKVERLPVRTSTADTWSRVAVSLVSFNSTSKGRTHIKSSCNAFVQKHGVSVVEDEH